MKDQRLAFVGVVAALCAVVIAIPVAQKGVAPRTREGRPDLQGVWSYATLTPLERPAEFAGQPFLTDAQAAASSSAVPSRFRIAIVATEKGRRAGDRMAGPISIAPTTRCGGSTAPRLSAPDGRR